MQLDVLSVLQLPNVQRAQSVPFVLQEDGHLTLKDYHEQQRRGASWPRKCTLFSCSRQARYADEADGETVQFVLVRESARPSTWALLADIEGSSSSIRVEQLRGHHALHTAPPAPSCLPYEHLLGLGLPLAFAKDEVLPDGPPQPLSTASTFLALRPCTKLEACALPQLVAHAYWRRSYPGLLVIAVAYDHEAQQLDTEPGKSALSANRDIAADPTDSAADGDIQQLDGQLQWQWHVLQITADLGHVGPVTARGNATASPPSPGSSTGPVLIAVRMAWHPQGDVLAVSIVDSDARSCVFSMHVRNHDMLWNTPWHLARRPSGEADCPAGGSCIAALCWVRTSWLLAVVDESGTLCLLDARNHGHPKAAALLCGAIKYGEVAHVRIGPILDNTAPQLSTGFAASNLDVRSPSNAHRRRRHGTSGCMGSVGSRAQSDHRQHVPLAGGYQPQQQQQLKARFSLATFVAGGVGAGTQAVPSPIMAVCNGSAVVLLRVLLPEPATPTTQYAAFPSGGGSIFGWLQKTPESVAATGADSTGGAMAAMRLDGSVGKTADLPITLRPSSFGVRVRAESQLERSSSVTTSAVSTPYMLGLQSAGGSLGPTPIATCQSTVSEALAPSWPLTWRTLLTLPLPGSSSPGLHGTPGMSATAAGQWTRGISHNTASTHTGAFGVHYPPMAPSSAAHVSRGGGFASLAPSTATLLETPASALGGLLPPHGSGSCSCFPGRSSRGGTEDGASERQANAAAATDGPMGRSGRGAKNGPRGSASSEEAGLVCAAPAAVQALQAGDVLVLRGKMVEALRHYPRAHIFGFLPAFLALVHLHRIDAAGQLLRAYARFTGRVAAAMAAVSKPPTDLNAGGDKAATLETAEHPATSPCDANPHSASELQHQWQSTMTEILNDAFSEHGHGASFPAPAPAPGTGAVTLPQLNSTGPDSALRFTRPASPTPDAFSLQPPDLSPSPSGTTDRIWDASASGSLGLMPGTSQQLQLLQQQQHDGMSGTGMASVPEEAVLEVASVRTPLPELPTEGCCSWEVSPPSAPTPVVVVASGRVEGSQRPSPLRIEDEGLAGTDGARAGRGEGPFPTSLALTDADGTVQADGAHQSDPGQDGDPSPNSPSESPHAGLVGPGEALRHMLRVCLQLLLLACQAMAFLAFSAYSAGRSETAAVAVDVSALPLSPASPPSPGGSVLSRQAMRRLSSTMRMRSLRTRSVSMYGNTGGYGAPHTGSPPSHPHSVLSQAMSAGAPTGTTQSRAEPPPPPLMPAQPVPPPANSGGTLFRAPSVVPPGISCPLNSGPGPGPAATTPRPPAPVPPVVIGFPIPVVWQPQPILHHAAQNHPHHPQYPHQRHHGQSPGRTDSTPSANSPGQAAADSHQHATASLVASQPPDAAALTTAGPTFEASISLAESGQTSPPCSPHNAGTVMRLQLHHCAFDAARLWADVSGQPLSISGQVAAAQYLKPSYAAGLLLMAHACSVQLRQLQQQPQQQPTLAHAHSNATEDVSQREKGVRGDWGGSGGEQLLEAIAVAGDDVASPGLAGAGQDHAAARVVELNGHVVSTIRAEDLQPSTQSQNPNQHLDTDRSKPQRLRAAADAAGPYSGGVHSPYRQQHHHHASNLLRGGSGTGAARVNWQLLRASAAATHAAAVWQSLNDWHRAALLVFACASALTQLGGGTADLPVEAANGRRPRRSVSDAKMVPRGTERKGLGRTASADSALADAAAAANAGGGGGDGDGILAAARASCLLMGQRVLLSQVAACQKMEVQDACSVLLELVALPRRLLGLPSSVHISLLQKVCSRVVGLLPARVCITPLLPAGPVPPLLQLSHAGIRTQLVAHCGATIARVLEELRLAAACGGAFVSMREAVQQIAEHTMVDSCVRMLLRWQGSYDGSRVDAMSARLPEAVADMLLLPDTPDWSPEAVLPTLQEAFVVSGLMSVTDAAAVVKAAATAAAAALEAAAATPHRGSGTGATLSLATPPAAQGPVKKPSPVGPGAAGAGAGPAVSELQDLDELALILDLSQLQHTLLAALQPFLHDALLRFRRPPSFTAGGTYSKPPMGEQLPDSADGAAAANELAGGRNQHHHEGDRADGGQGGDWWIPEDEAEEEEDEEVLGDPSALAALAPVDLATWCLKLLLKLQWALYCRAQVCALMLRLVQLQAPPSSAPVPVKPKAATDTHAVVNAVTAASTAIAIPVPSGLCDKPPGPTAISPCSRHLDSRHSFRDFIQSRASNTASVPPALAQHANNTPWAQTVGCSGGAAAALAPVVDGTHCAGPATDQQCILRPATAEAEAAGALYSTRCTEQQQQHMEQQPPQQGAESVALSPLCGIPQRGELDGMGTGCQDPQEAISEAGCMLLTREEDLDTVQGALMAWTAALVRADKFHSPSELQGCTLAVLNMVRSCPLQLVTELDKALERRAIRNKSIAIEVRRLQRAAPPPGADSSSDAPARAAAPQPTQAQRAVMLVQADIQATTLNLLECFADPSGALPSGLSGQAVGDGGGCGDCASPPRVARVSAASGHSCGGGGAAGGCSSGHGSDVDGCVNGPILQGTKAATWHGCVRTPASPPRLSRRRQRHVLTSSRAVSRATSLNTLLQCLVCELVRNSHSVTASVSWRASLEGSRGLASCFVHPILHGDGGGGGGGGSRASVVETTRGLALGKSPVGHVPLSTAVSTFCEELEGLGNAPTAEGAQEMLLSLMDVGQWVTTSKPTVLGGSIVGNGGISAALASLPAGEPLHGRRRRSIGGKAAATAAATAAVGDDLDKSSRMGRAGSPQRTKMARKDMMTASVAAWRCNGHQLMGGISTDVDTDSEARDGGGEEGRSARSINGGAACSTLGSPGRLSFSGLTDGGADCTYPAAPGTATSDGRTPSDRHGNSSMRRHNNPAFGLHSPTPSNMSEAWEDASDMTSPSSTQVNTRLETSIGGAAAGSGDSRPSTAEGRTYNAWKAGSFAGGAAAAGRDVCLQASREPVAGVLVPVVVCQRGDDASSQVDDEKSGQDGGGGGGKDSQKEAVGDEKKMTAEDGDMEGDQPATLSYLVNVNALDEIRNAVRQAHEEDAADAGAGAGATNALNAESPPVPSLRIPLTASAGISQQSLGSPNLQPEPLRASVSEVSVRESVASVPITSNWPALLQDLASPGRHNSIIQSPTAESGSTGLGGVTLQLAQTASAASSGSTAQGKPASSARAAAGADSSDTVRTCGSADGGEFADGAAGGSSDSSASGLHIREDILSPMLPRAQKPASPTPSPPRSPPPPQQHQAAPYRPPRPPAGPGPILTRATSWRVPSSPPRSSNGLPGRQVQNAEGRSSSSVGNGGGGGGGASQNSPSRRIHEPQSPNAWSVASSISLASPRALRAVRSSNALSPPSTPAMSPLPTDVTLLHPPPVLFSSLQTASGAQPTFPAQNQSSSNQQHQHQQPDLQRLGWELFPQTATEQQRTNVPSVDDGIMYDMPSAFDRPSRSPSVAPTGGRDVSVAISSATGAETAATVLTSGIGSSDIQINDFLRIPPSTSKSMSIETSSLGSFPSEFFQTPTSSQPTETPSLTSMLSQPFQRKTSITQSTKSPGATPSPEHPPPAQQRGTDATTHPTPQLPPTTSLLSPYSSGAFSTHSSFFGNAASKGLQSSSLIPGRSNSHIAHPRQGAGGPPGSASGAAANTRQPPPPPHPGYRHTGGIPTRPGTTTAAVGPAVTTSRPSISAGVAAGAPAGLVTGSNMHQLPGAQRASAANSLKLRSTAAVAHVHHYNTTILSRNAEHGGNNARKQQPPASGSAGGSGGGSTTMGTAGASGIPVVGGKGPPALREASGRQGVHQPASAFPAESSHMRRRTLDMSRSGEGISQGGAVNPLFNASAAVALGAVERDVAWGSPRSGGGRGSGGGASSGASAPGGGSGARTQSAKTSSFDQRRFQGPNRGVWH